MKNTGLALLQGQFVIILIKSEVSSAYEPFKFLKINVFLLDLLLAKKTKKQKTAHFI